MVSRDDDREAGVVGRVRALARVDDERVSSLRGRGPDVVIGDLDDQRSLRNSLEGVEAAYFALR